MSSQLLFAHAQGTFDLVVDGIPVKLDKGNRTSARFIGQSKQGFSNLWFTGESSDQSWAMTFKLIFKQSHEMKNCDGSEIIGSYSGERVGPGRRIIWVVNNERIDRENFDIFGNFKSLKNNAEIFWLIREGDHAIIDIEKFNSGIISGTVDFKLTQAGTDNTTHMRGSFTLPITGCH
ncbi:MAG: hypothetical protein O2887_08470 [Bacteroidetes bacterium]|nr:hypothetical protein [Bacteroidota bacterium]